MQGRSDVSPERMRQRLRSGDPDRLLADVDSDSEDRAALERSRRLVLLADVVSAVAPDAEAVPGQRELADLLASAALRQLCRPRTTWLCRLTPCTCRPTPG